MTGGQLLLYCRRVYSNGSGVTIPDLASDGLLEFWRGFDPALASLIARMDQAEPWTLDQDPAIGERLVGLGRRLTSEHQAIALAGADRESLLLFFAYISTSRALRVIHWMDQLGGHGVQLVERLLQQPAEVASVIPLEPLRDLLTHRLRVISNTPYVAKLFAPERLHRLQRAIRQYKEETSHVA